MRRMKPRWAGLPTSDPVASACSYKTGPLNLVSFVRVEVFVHVLLTLTLVGR